MAVMAIPSYYTIKFFSLSHMYWVFFAAPLTVGIIFLPDYLKTFYFLIKNKPVIILTTNSLINCYKGIEHKWSEIETIDYRSNAPAFGYHIAVQLKNSEIVIAIPETKLKCKRWECLQMLLAFRDEYIQNHPTEVLESIGLQKEGLPFVN